MILVGWLALLLSARAAPRGEEAVDHLELATVLVRDGSYDRAAGVLAQVDPEDDSVDLARFHLLRGLVRLNLSQFADAAADLEAAIARSRAAEEEGDEDAFDPILYVYLGQARFYLDEFREALNAFASAGARGEAIPGTFALRAEAHRRLGETDTAWEVLVEGSRRHPDDPELIRRRTFLAIELQLYQTAADLGRAYLSRAEADAADYLAVGRALRQSGSDDEALAFLELGHLRFPESEAVVSELATIYQQRGQPRTAALLLERASLAGSDDLALAAAELYRRVGEPWRALALNARIADSPKRLRQRLGIAIEQERFQVAAAMERDLSRVGLLEEDALRYALAYAHFRTGSYDRADALLADLGDPEVFRRATELRKAMADCRAEPWRC